MRKWLALGVQVPFVAMMWVACSGDTNNGSDAGDSSIPDVAPDKKAPADVAQVDTGGGGCAPETTIDTSQIKFIPPITPLPNGCSDAQITGLWNACFGTSATQTACTTFEGAAANKTCVGCMLSTWGTSTAFGTLVAISGVDYANISGCIALETGDQSATSCAAKEQAVLNCEILACSPSCPKITDQTTFKEWTTCTTAADNGVCKTYVDGVCNLADAGAEAGAAYQTCQNHQAFQDYYNALSPIFCGGYPADAGVADSGTDSSTTDAATDAPDDGG
jgi:hypothetical protein